MVAAQEVVEVLAAPERLTVAVGDRERLHLSAFDDRGNLAENPVYHLAVGDSRVARVESDASVVGVAPGITRVVIRSGTGRAEVTVTVLGQDVTGDTVPSHALVTSNHGLQIARLRVRPHNDRPLELVLGQDSLLDVIPLAPDSTVVVTQIRWSSLDNEIARVSSAGAVSAVGAGDTQVAAHVIGVDVVRWTVRVRPKAIRVHPDSPVVMLGDSVVVQFSIQGTESGTHSRLAPVVIESADSSTILPGSAGVLHGVSRGATKVFMETEWGYRDSVTVRVGLPLLTSLRNDGDGASLAALNQDGSDHQVLLADGATNLFPSYSPDHSLVAFASDRSGRFDIYLAPLDSMLGQAPLISSAGHNTQPVWTLDGRYLLFTSTRTGSPQIFRIELASGELVQLTDVPSGAHSPAASPDGNRVAFVAGGGVADRVFELDLTTGRISPVPFSDLAMPARSPRYLPDGSLAAVAQIGATGATSIVRYARDGTRVPVLTSNDRIESFAISRDGRKLLAVIVSSAGRDERPRVLLVDLASRSSRELSFAPGGGRLQYPSF